MHSKFELVCRLRAHAGMRRKLDEMAGATQVNKLALLLDESANVIYEDQRFKNSWFYKVWKFFDSL